MSGVEKINVYLGHLERRDLPVDELLRLKAEAFEACAVDAREWGDTRHAEACEAAALHAREARRLEQ